MDYPKLLRSVRATGIIIYNRGKQNNTVYKPNWLQCFVKKGKSIIRERCLLLANQLHETSCK